MRQMVFSLAMDFLLLQALMTFIYYLIEFKYLDAKLQKSVMNDFSWTNVEELVQIFDSIFYTTGTNS